MLQGLLKRNGILIATLVAYAAAVFGTALGIDLLVYQVQKKELINMYPDTELFGVELREFYTTLEEWTRVLTTGGDPQPALDAFTAASRKIIHGSSPIYRIQLLGPGGETLLDEDESAKRRQFNSFSNSLWIRDYSHRRGGRRELTLLTGEKRPVAFWFYFTTPGPELASLQDNLERLTRDFRVLTLLIEFLYTVGVVLFMRQLLLPIRGVTSAIELSGERRTRFIPRTRTPLERLYNQMARGTVLARLQEALGERVHGEEAQSHWDLIEFAVEFLIQQGAVALAGVAEICGADEGNGKTAVITRSFIRRLPKAFAEMSDGAISESLWLNKEKPSDEGRADLQNPLVAKIIADPMRPGVRYGLCLGAGGAAGALDLAASQDLAGRLAGILGGAIEALDARARTLTRERDRASINLSRNLGHDLTNIIATSKLELLALEKLLKPGAPPPEGVRREILDQSLAGLLNSTKFLQEVVNLYRAYAYLKEPAPEDCAANTLAADTIRLFQLSTSGKVGFTQDLDPADPRFNADPRLIKLALFNLFSNALDAIQRGEEASGEKPGSGVIHVSTRAGEGGGVEIVVRDSGPGIRTAEGALMPQGEIEQIFGLGYTVGREGEGEGLGLNWVRTIVQDIHGGVIRAENAPEGGARFTLKFPPSV